jgi:hypothetical protein
VGRARSKSWEPAAIELLEALKNEPIYSREQLDAIVAMIGNFGEEKHAAVSLRIEDIGVWLFVTLHNEQRPKSPEIRTALSSLAEQLQSLLAALRGLDSQSRSSLTSVAGRAPRDLRFESKAFEGRYGEPRMQRALGTLEGLHGWVATAISEQPKGSPGRRSIDHARETAFLLLDLWKIYALRPSNQKIPLEPTSGQFLQLLRAVTQPVYSRYCLALDLRSACRQVLIEGWQPDWPELAETD